MDKASDEMRLGPAEDDSSSRFDFVTRVWKKSEAVVLPLLGLIVGIGLWAAAVEVFEIPQFMLPSPLAVAETIQAEWRLLLDHAIHTTTGFGLGFLLGVVVGVPLAIAMAYSRVLSRIFYPLIVVTQALPKVALAPLFLVWVGFGLTSQVLIAFLICFFPILINTVTGLQGVPREFDYLALSMGGGQTRTFFKVRLPYAMPTIWAGFKVAITLAVVGAVVGEFVASNKGLGYLVNLATQNIKTSLAFATLFVLAMIAVIAFMLIELLGKFLVPRSRNVR